MKKTTISICSILFLSTSILFFSCNNDGKSTKSDKLNKALSKLAEQFSEGCIEGNEGKDDWEAYCDCAAENFAEQLKEMGLKDIASITDDDAMAMGLEAGIDCAHLLSDEDFNFEDSEETNDIMFEFLYQSCMEGEDGSEGWSDYCSCFAENAMEMVPTMEEWANMSEEEGYQIGLEAGMDCLEYLEY